MSATAQTDWSQYEEKPQSKAAPAEDWSQYEEKPQAKANESPAEVIARGGSPQELQTSTQRETKTIAPKMQTVANPFGYDPDAMKRIAPYEAMGEERELAEGAPVGAAGLVTLGSGGETARLLPEIVGASGAAATGAATGGASGAVSTVTHQLLNRQNPFRVRNLEDTGENALIGAGTGTAAGVASVAPKVLRPAARFILPRLGHAVTGAVEGKYAGREVGDLFGEPEEGGTAGAVLGGGYGLITGRDPGVSIVGRAGKTLGRTFGAGLREGMENAEPVQVGGPPTRTADESVVREPVQQKPESVVARPSRPPAAEIPAAGQEAALERATRQGVTIPQEELPAKTEGMSTREISDLIDQATGNKPVVKGVPLREQPRMTPPRAPEPEAAMPKSLAEKYPDKAQRQMVHANGERMYEAAKGNPETLKAIHGMNRVDLRQALINSGADMADKVVSDSKFAGEGAIPRQAAFERLLDKGYTPEQIVELGKQPIGPHATAVPPARAVIAGPESAAPRAVGGPRGTIPPEEYGVRVENEAETRQRLQRIARERARRIREARKEEPELTHR